MTVRWQLLVVTVALGALSGNAGAPPADPVPHRLTGVVAAGRHQRLETDHGIVHVWVPAGYHPDGAATIVYVHGYFTDVDHAWTAYQLPEQFALSALNAVFIACEAPSGQKPRVSWTSLDELVGTVYADTGIVRPMGPVIAVGHSGAFRTLEEWLDEPLLDEIAMIDAAYSDIEPFEAWLRAAPRRRIIDVTEDTVQWSEEMARDLGDLSPIGVDRFPLDDREWPEGVRDARLVTVRAQWSHMDLVTGGIVLPMVLRLLPVDLLADGPWDAPLGDLPPLPPEKP